MNNDYEIVHNAKVNTTVFKNRLSHPSSQKKYAERDIAKPIKQYVSDFFSQGTEPRMIGLAGLRGTGKTTLLWHLAEYIHSNHTTEIYFFNINTFRSLGISIFKALEYFQTHILKQRFNTFSKPIVFLFDEVHDDPDWSRALKILYDEARTAFVICTGSSALLLQQTADLTRRMHITKVYPFNFTEYIKVKTYFTPPALPIDTDNKNKSIVLKKEVSSQLKDCLLFSTNAETAFNKIQSLQKEVNNYYDKISGYCKSKETSPKQLIFEYINYHNIPTFLFFANKSIINDNVINLFKRIIWEDIPKIAQDNNSYINSEKLLLRLSISDEINIDSLSQTIGIKKEEILRNIDILAKAELLNILIPYGGADSKINKMKKAFFMSPSLRRALLSQIYGEHLGPEIISKFYEDIIVMYLKRILPDSILSFVSQQKVNADFVIETMDKPILLEIGLNKKTTRQIQKSKIDYRYGIVINAQTQEIELKGDVIVLPLFWFLLL